MKRIFFVYNPRSSRHAEVEQAVLAPARNLKGYVVGKYEVKPTTIEDNIATFAKLLKDGDLVISAGGDATGVIAINGILKSKKDVTFGALPYGNFNDLARTLGTMKYEDVFGIGSHGRVAELGGPPWSFSDMGENARTGPVQRKLYPLEIIIDGQLWRYATCYVTIGMTASAVYIYDQPKMRKKLKTHFGRSISSYTMLASWYFKHRLQKQFLPNFSLNGVSQSSKTSDYIAINGRSMARVMKGGADFQNPTTFRHETGRLTNFFRLASFMLKSIFHRVPSTETTGDILEFTTPTTIALQAEGEHITLKNVKKIEIKKAPTYLKVITH